MQDNFGLLLLLAGWGVLGQLILLMWVFLYQLRRMVNLSSRFHFNLYIFGTLFWSRCRSLDFNRSNLAILAHLLNWVFFLGFEFSVCCGNWLKKTASIRFLTGVEIFNWSRYSYLRCKSTSNNVTYLLCCWRCRLLLKGVGSLAHWRLNFWRLFWFPLWWLPMILALFQVCCDVG